MQKLVSVLIPTRNRVNRLLRCIQSFEKNTRDYSKIELILKIDNDDHETINFVIAINTK